MGKPEADADIIAQIPKEEYQGCVLQVRQDFFRDSYKNFFRIDGVRKPNGAMLPGGYVKREYEGFPTLVPRPDGYVSTGTTGGRRSDGVEAIRQCDQGVAQRRSAAGIQNDLSEGYPTMMVKRYGNSFAHYANGGIVWHFAEEITEENSLVRVILRKVVFSDKGYGKDIVFWMEAEAVKQ